MGPAVVLPAGFITRVSICGLIFARAGMFVLAMIIGRMSTATGAFAGALIDK